MRDERPLGPPYCDEPNPTDENGPEPIRCAFRKGHDGPHGWDLRVLWTPPMTVKLAGERRAS